MVNPKAEQLDARSVQEWLSCTGSPKIISYTTHLARRRPKAFTADEIVSMLDKVVRPRAPKIENLAGLPADLVPVTFQQFIFGIARPGPDGGIDQYVVQMMGRLAEIRTDPVFYPFLFEGSQQRQLKKVLTELAAHFRVSLDVAKMARQAGMNERMKRQRFFLMVTAVPVTVVDARPPANW